MLNDWIYTKKVNQVVKVSQGDKQVLDNTDDENISLGGSSNDKGNSSKSGSGNTKPLLKPPVEEVKPPTRLGKIGNSGKECKPLEECEVWVDTILYDFDLSEEWGKS